MRINNVEVTNHCNMKCRYCPHPKMTRKKGFMSQETYEKVLDKQELDYMELHNFGEPLLHEKIYNFIRMAKARGYKTQLSTNGTLLTEDVMDNLVNAGLDLLWISIRPAFEKVKKFLEKKYEKYSKDIEIVILYVEFTDKTKPLPKNWKITPIIPHTWSGQIDLPYRKRNEMCDNLRLKAVTVLWDGRVSNCCHDYDGKYTLGTIDDNGLEPKPNKLCEGCEFYGAQ